MNPLVSSLGLVLCTALATPEPIASQPLRERPSDRAPRLDGSGEPSVLVALGVPIPSFRAVITEFMKDPNAVSDTSGEWIEVYNPLPWRLDLEGWSLGDDDGPEHVISNGGAGVYVRPGQHFVLGRNGDPATNGGVLVDYVYTTTSLANGADEIVLRKRNGQIADRVAYDDGVLWPDLAGQSISLTPAASDPAANDDPMNWCHASSSIAGAGSDLGTPGAPNDVCP
jgi:hypothetical protein